MLADLLQQIGERAPIDRLVAPLEPQPERARPAELAELQAPQEITEPPVRNRLVTCALHPDDGAEIIQVELHHD